MKIKKAIKTICKLGDEIKKDDLIAAIHAEQRDTFYCVYGEAYRGYSVILVKVE